MGPYDKLVSSYSKSLVLTLVPELSSTNQLNEGLAKIKNAQLSTLFKIGDELFQLGALFTASSTIKNYLQNPTYSEEKKLALIFGIFLELSSFTKAFLKVLAERKHLYLLPDIAKNLQEHLSKVQQISKVKMIVASPLEHQFGPKIIQLLKTLTKSAEITLEVQYDPSLLGGFRLEYSSFILDASLVKDIRSILV